MRLLLSIIIALAATLASISYKPHLIVPTLHAYRATPILGQIANRTIPLLISCNMNTTKNFEGIPAIPPQDPSLNAPANTTVPRKIRMHFEAIETPEGEGAMVRRSIGTQRLKDFSPFLMLDHFNVAKGGFPDHPHRGQETITYLLDGIIDHEDFVGNAGALNPGDLQFMTAGRGIMHAEMPRHGPGLPVVNGFQLWVDLPKKLKKCEPRYRDLKAAEIPEIKLDDDKVTVKIISGQSHGTDSVQELAYTPVWLLDITIKPGGKITQNIPVGWNAFAYSWQGTTTFGVGRDAAVVPKYHNTVFEQAGDAVVAENDADNEEDVRFSKS